MTLLAHSLEILIVLSRATGPAFSKYPGTSLHAAVIYGLNHYLVSLWLKRFAGDLIVA